MSIEIPSISHEPVSTLIAAVTDPTGLPVRFAFTTPVDADGKAPEPADADWKTGVLGTAVQQPDGRWQARAEVTIGPGTDLVLTNGEYGAWVRVVTNDPNGPTRQFDVITIT